MTEDGGVYLSKMKAGGSKILNSPRFRPIL